MDSDSPNKKLNVYNFCQLWKFHHNPELRLEGTEVSVVDQYKYLGIIFDKKIILHAKYEIPLWEMQ